MPALFGVVVHGAGVSDRLAGRWQTWALACRRGCRCAGSPLPQVQEREFSRDPAAQGHGQARARMDGNPLHPGVPMGLVLV